MRNTRFGLFFLTINLIIPVILRPVIASAMPNPTAGPVDARWVLVALAAIAIFTFNEFLARRYRRFRVLIWSLSVLNVLSFFLMGSISFLTSLAGWKLLVMFIISGGG